jgi:hypothetical protein
MKTIVFFRGLVALAVLFACVGKKRTLPSKNIYLWCGSSYDSPSNQGTGTAGSVCIL